jgi:hypothetical protein
MDSFRRLLYDPKIHKTLSTSAQELIRSGNCYVNSLYIVVKRAAVSNCLSAPDVIHLSIKRIDNQPIRSWKDLQTIKNSLTEPEYEGIELFPAESRKVDFANQYHLWIVKDKRFRFPFSFSETDDLRSV